MIAPSRRTEYVTDGPGLKEQPLLLNNLPLDHSLHCIVTLVRIAEVRDVSSRVEAW